MQSAPREASAGPAPLDQARINHLLERLFAALNGSALAVFVSIGHKSGLIKTMLQMPPATSEQIAEGAGLQERYVREWLGGMVVCGIVDYAPDKAHIRPTTGACHCLDRQCRSERHRSTHGIHPYSRWSRTLYSAVFSIGRRSTTRGLWLFGVRARQ
jgi:hypothetical protein